MIKMEENVVKIEVLETREVWQDIPAGHHVDPSHTGFGPGDLRHAVVVSRNRSPDTRIPVAGIRRQKKRSGTKPRG